MLQGLLKPADLPMISNWRLRTQILSFTDTPKLMGIVNVTPDSFSDGGNFMDPLRAVDHGLKLVAEGAAILDIGGESTRPYSEPVSESEELRRVIPVIEKLVSETHIPISIDTSKPKVAAEAIAAGAEIINDVTGFENPQMISVASETAAGICVMHMQGTPQTMQDKPQYQDVVGEILEYLAKRKSQLKAAGIATDRICLDPGIGFGKTHDHNVELIRKSYRFLELNSPILVGHSRKGFIGKLSAGRAVSPSVAANADRDAGTLAITLLLAQQGIHIIRVHDVARTFQAVQVDRAIRQISAGSQ